MIRPPPSSPLFPYPPLFRSLFLNPRAAIQKWRQQLIHACLELLRRLRAEAEKVPQNCAKNQQRDNICAAHRDCGLRTADCRLKGIDVSGKRQINPQSETSTSGREHAKAFGVANPQSFLPPLPIS